MAMDMPDIHTMPTGFEIWWCEATITSNPDISGIGVISAFFFQSFLATIIGFYMYYISGRWARLRSFPALVYRHIFRTRRLRGIPSLVTPIIPVDPRRTDMMADMIVLTSDMQTLSGIALMVAALSQMKGLSMYHAVLVGNIGWIPSQSHHLAIIYVWEAHPHGRHQRVRYMAIAVYAVMYLVFCAVTYSEVKRRWNLNNDCFIACKKAYCVGSFLERDAMLSWILVNLVLFGSSYMPILLHCVTGCFGGEYGWLKFLGDLMFSAFTSQVVMLFWTVFTLNGVDGYRKANRKLLNDENAEERWGFGQVIAVVSLLLVAFECWKTYFKYKDGPDPNDPALCRCRCFCGKRVDSFSSVESGETLVEETAEIIIPPKVCGSGSKATGAAVDEMTISPC